MSDMSLIPPDNLIREHSGGIDRATFIAMGEQIATHSLIAAAGLSASGRLLDVGCGCGKIARPLVAHLNRSGGYDGIDITHAAIDWCRSAYGAYPNFRFHLADLKSARYNTGGASLASTYRFPFEDKTFDVVFLGSVFTHMLPVETANYLREIGRVLKPGGRCLSTFFLLDDVSRGNVDAGRTTPAFAYGYQTTDCRIEVESIPEAAIAYDVGTVRSMVSSAGLSLDAINFGQWGRGQLIPHWQDEIWSSRPASS